MGRGFTFFCLCLFLVVGQFLSLKYLDGLPSLGITIQPDVLSRQSEHMLHIDSLTVNLHGIA